MDSVTHFTKCVDCSHVVITDSSQTKFINTNYLLKHFIEWKIARRLYVTGRRFGRGKQLLDDLKKRGYWKLKDEALARTLWTTRFVRGCGLVVRQTAEWVNAHTWLYRRNSHTDLKETLTLFSEDIRVNGSWFDSIFHLRSNKQFSGRIVEKIKLVSEML